ncbi:MBL fold metallo-hydrolase [candidate division WOR-3 bacterium]|nr:MBL fold metallo-hydrolase [candidate division WOR-3 bacterium]
MAEEEMIAGQNCFKLGEFELYPISDGYFWLDGGALFGVVPKVLWSRFLPADPENRVKLALNCLLVRARGKCVLIDTGLGDKFSKRLREIYKAAQKAKLLDSLAALNVKPSDIDYVINTHLHFDHCGGNTQNENGKYVPTFPNARYFIQQQEWFCAQNLDERTRSSYRASDFMPIEEAGQVEFVDGDEDVIPGIKVLLTNGHTLGHQSVMITSKQGRALYPGDLIPTAHHLKAQYLTAFDLYPVDLISRKKEIVQQALREKWLFVLEHDPDMVFCRLTEDGGVVKPVPVSGRITRARIRGERQSPG